jgi:hypothetical protein
MRYQAYLRIGRMQEGNVVSDRRLITVCASSDQLRASISRAKAAHQ